MRKCNRGKGDIFGMLMVVIIIGIVGGGGLWCYSSYRAASDPANKRNYWNENTYTFRSDMERADRELEQGRFEAARRGYEEAVNANTQNRVSSVLQDRIDGLHQPLGLLVLRLIDEGRHSQVKVWGQFHKDRAFLHIIEAIQAHIRLLEHDVGVDLRTSAETKVSQAGQVARIRPMFGLNRERVYGHTYASHRDDACSALSRRRHRHDLAPVNQHQA